MGYSELAEIGTGDFGTEVLFRTAIAGRDLNSGFVNVNEAIFFSINTLDVPDSSDLFAEIGSWRCEMQYPSNKTATVFREILAEMPVADPLLVGGGRGSLSVDGKIF